MEAITGNPNLVSKQGVLRGFKLCIQRRDQVPNTVFSNSPVQISPRQIIEENWGEEFETYMIKPGKKTDVVMGTVWELTPLERELVRDWELVDFGWYKDMRVRILVNGQEVDVQTEGFREGQEVDREVDGIDYPPFLNNLSDFQRVAEKARREYLERIKIREGVPVGKES